MQLRPPTDARLVERALALDAGAFEALVVRHQKKVHAIARAAGLRGSTVEDVVQEAFLAAFRGLRGLKDPAAFGAWVLGIVRNLARKRLRVDLGAALPLSAERAEASEPAAPVARESLESRELSDILWRKVAELPKSLREVTYLYYHEGESVRSVAAALGVSRDAVKSRLQRGRDLLRGQLWRELRQSLRDMLPAAREWKRAGRRLTLLAIASTAPGKEAAARAAAMNGASQTCTTFLGSILFGGIVMGTKKITILAALCFVVFGSAASVVFSTMRYGDSGNRRPPAAARTAPQDFPASPRAVDLGPAVATEPPQLGRDPPPSALLELRDLRSDEPIDPRSAELLVEPPKSGNALARGRLVEVRFAEEGITVSLVIRLRGYVEQSVDVDPGDAAAGTPPFPIYLDPGITISGDVVDKLTDEPLQGAGVAALRVLAKDREPSLEEEPISVTRSAEDGRFRVTGIGPGDRVVLKAEAAGYATRYQEVRLATAEDATGVRIELEHGATLHGVVRAEAPALAGLLTRTKVVLQPTKDCGWPASIALSRELVALRAGSSEDDQVSFDFPGLPAAQYRINVEPDDDAFAKDNWTEPFRAGAEDDPTVRVVLAWSAQTIRGTVVTSEGKPFAKALACVAEASGGTLFCETVQDDGSFELHRARRGKPYKIFVFAPDADGRTYDFLRNPDVYVLDPRPARESLRVKLSFGGEDVSSAPVSFVFFDPADGKGGGGGGLFVPAQHKLPVGAYRKVVLYGGVKDRRYAPKQIDVGALAEPEAVLEMEEGATLSGRVVTDTGKPVQGATLKAMADGLGRWETTATTGADGAFVLNGLPRDPASLKIDVSNAGEWQSQGEIRVSSYDAPATIVLVQKAAQ